MSEPSPLDGTSKQARKPAQKQRLFSPILPYVAFGVILIFFFLVALGPVGQSVRKAEESGMLQQAHMIALAMFQYANDHNLNYPDGKNSTEVFQKLIDGEYVNDPSLFYVPMVGKTKPSAGQPLNPENVCWDVTSTVDGSAPDGLPLVFSTGYKVNYVPGGAAVPIMEPNPKYQESDQRSWWERLWGTRPTKYPPSTVVCYKSNANILFKSLKISTSENPDGSIPNFVPANFDPQGKTYRQLTPDGVLPDK